jgi:hypothetical protein
LFLESKFNREITSENALSKAFDMTTDISVSVNQFTVVVSLVVVDLLVWEDNVSSERLSHQKILTKSSRATSEHFIRVRWNNSAESENKIVDLLLVKEVGSDGV